MRDYYIFDIPVYGCSEKRYSNAMDNAVAKRHDEIFSMTGISREKAPESYKNSETHTRRAFGGPWHFNQVVGWLRLFAESSHIGGHLWWIDARRINKVMRHKRFYLKTASDVLGTYFTKQDDSETIYRKTLKHINVLKRQAPLKGRYIDLENFCNIGPFVDWRGLLFPQRKIDTSQKKR